MCFLGSGEFNSFNKCSNYGTKRNRSPTMKLLSSAVGAPLHSRPLKVSDTTAGNSANLAQRNNRTAP